MPTIKRSGIKAQETKTGFEAYAGVDPKRGVYRAKVTRVKYKKFKANADGVQNEGLELVVSFEAQKGDPKGHKQFDGYPAFPRIVFGDKEMMIAREQNFYAALGVKDEPAIITEAGDMDAGVTVTKIGGKNPVGAFVNVDLRQRRNGEEGMEVDGIYPVKEIPVSTDVDDEDEAEEDESDLVEESDEDEEGEAEDDAEDDEYSVRQAELEGFAIPKLKKIAKDLGAPVGGTKDVLVERILELEFEEGEPDDEEEEAEEDDVEVEEDEEEAEEGEDEEVDARRAELSELDRAGLKKVLKDVNPDAKVFPRFTDEDLVEMILGVEFSDTPF